MSAKRATKNTAGRKAPMVVVSDPELAGSGRGAGVPTKPPTGKTVGATEAEKERRGAFYGAEREWKGLELTGMTSGRWGVFLEMRAGVTSLAFLDSLGGDGWFADSIRILYFCATSPADWRPFRRDAMDWQEEIERWGDEHVPRDERIAAEALAFEIYKDSNINRHEVGTAGKGAGGAGK